MTDTEYAEPELVQYAMSEPASLFPLRSKEQGQFPWPSAHNPMLEYLVTQGRQLIAEGEPEQAIVYVAVHAWYEGALAALSLSATDDPPPLPREKVQEIARIQGVSEQQASATAERIVRTWAENRREIVLGTEG